MSPALRSSSVRLLFALAAALSLCHCASKPPAARVTDDGTYWVEQPVVGEPKIVISLDEQRVGFFKGGKLVGLSPISSGREGFDTRPGNFRVTEKDEDHRSSLYGAYLDASGAPVMEDVCTRTDPAPPGTTFAGAEMHFFMRFNGAIGMHQGYLPGYPASHGCIRLPAKMAALFYYATPHGTPVEVRPNAGLRALRSAVIAPVVAAQPEKKKAAPSALPPQSLQSVTKAAPLAKPSLAVTPKPTHISQIPATKARPAPPAAKPLPVKKKKVGANETMYLPGYGPQ